MAYANPEEPIPITSRENLKFYAPINKLTLIGRYLGGIYKREEKEMIKQEIKSVQIGYLD